MATSQKRPKRRWWAVAARPQSGPPPPIDGLTGATVAAGYSLRKLRSAYAGAAVNIRRSSDNAVQNVGFAGNGFDAASYAGFVGAGTAFNASWYDQGGNAANAVQATAGNQPTVMPDSSYYGSNSTYGSTQVLAAPDAVPIQNIFATGGLLQVALRCPGGANVSSIVSKGAWVLYFFAGGGDQVIWFYQKAATTDGFWNATNVVTSANRHIVTVAYNASVPATAPVITLDGVTCNVTTGQVPVGAATSDIGSVLELHNNAVINANDHAMGGSLYEVILLKGTPSAVVAAALNANARTFYGTS